MKIVTTWDFVQAYYPKYHSCDSIAYNDDIQKIKDGEINGCAEKIYKELKEQTRINFGKTLNDEALEEETMLLVEREWNESCADIFERAIEGFIEQTNKEF